MKLRWGGREQKGVLLLEALLVLVVLSMSLTLMVQAMSASLRATQQNADYADAVLLMDNKMFAVMTEGTSGDTYTGQEDLDEPYDGYSLRMQNQPILSPEVSDKLRALDLDLVWARGKNIHSLRMTTYLLDGFPHEVK
jgi:Tfp pilus assembly protein PilV